MINKVNILVCHMQNFEAKRIDQFIFQAKFLFLQNEHQNSQYLHIICQ